MVQTRQSLINKKGLAELACHAYEEGRRLAVPLMGFPGLNETGVSIKLAQQNYGEHYRVIKYLAKRFEPDMIFPLMDLSVEANALGRYTLFPKDDSATVVQDVFHIEELEAWEAINISFDNRIMGYVETMKLMSIGLNGVLRGAYVAGPYSLAALIMGASKAAMLSLTEPDKLNRLCEFCTERIQEYVRLLIGAGAQVICILEPSAVMLGPNQFKEFSARYIRHISTSCRFTGINFVYHTCGNTTHLIDKMTEAEVDGVSLDSSEVGINLPEIAQRVSRDVAVIGNINPTTTMLSGTAEAVYREVKALLQAMDPYPHFVLSTGCDLPQETPLANIEAFMAAGREHKITR